MCAKNIKLFCSFIIISLALIIGIFYNNRNSTDIVESISTVESDVDNKIVKKDVNEEISVDEIVLNNSKINESPENKEIESNIIIKEEQEESDELKDDEKLIGNDLSIEHSPENVGNFVIINSVGYEKFKFNEYNANVYIESVNKYAENLIEDIKIYNLIAPTSSEFNMPDEYRDLSDSQKEGIGYAYSNMDNKIITVDAYSNIEAHKNEYLYFKTDHHWTALGAFRAFLFMGLALVYINLPMSKDNIYETNASMVINSKTYTINSEIEVSGKNDIYLSQKMVNTYRVILLSDNVLERVNKDLGTNINISLMRSWLTVSSPKDTEVIMVSVKDADPQLAADIANSIMRVAPQVISETVEVGSIKVLDEAKVPNVPIPQKKNNTLYLAIGCVIGLMGGVFIVFLIHFLRPCLKSKKEMVELVAINCLGEIPHVKNKLRYKQNPLVLIKNIDNSFVEGYKVLTETVMHVCDKSDIKTIVITSAVPEEGKTNVSVNLALSIASAGKKTLLLDFDCYKDGVLGISRKRPGKCLLDVLKEGKNLKEAIMIEPDTGLHIMYSKKGKVGDISFLNSEIIREFFNDIKKSYDYVIIDTPPALIQSEAVSLSKYIDGVIMVARQEAAPIIDIIEAKNRILNVGAEIIGGVVNDIRYLVGTEYSHKYYYAHNYYYSFNKEKENKKILWKKTVSSILFLLMIVCIIYFATRTGEEIIKMSDDTMNFIFSKMDQLGFIENTIQSFDGKTSEITSYGAEIGYWAKAMEHWIHSILFFILTIVTMNLLGAYDVKTIYSVIVTIVLFVIFSVGNEYYQSLFIEGRGYEFRDVVFSMVGMLVGFIVYWIFKFITSNRQSKPKNEKVKAVGI